MLPDTDDAIASNSNLVECTCAIVQAYVGNHRAAAADITGLIKDIHSTLAALARSSGDAPATTQKPAVPPKKSITPDYIVCLEDGKKLKMLKRYLNSRFGLSPDQYRAKWNLPADYPMTAPNYAMLRSQFAKKIGLGKRSAGKTRKRKRGL